MNSIEEYENKNNVLEKSENLTISNLGIKLTDDDELIKNKITNFEIIDSSIKIKNSNCFVKNYNKYFQSIFIKSCWLINNKIANKILIFLIISISCWLIAFILLGNKSLPGGIVFSLFVLFISAHSIGFLIEKIKLPSLLGNEFFFKLFC